MTLLEVVDRLCRVTELQSEIIRKQTEIIEQAKIADAVSDELASMKKSVSDELSLVGGDSLFNASDTAQP